MWSKIMEHLLEVVIFWSSVAAFNIVAAVLFVRWFMK